MMGAFGGRKAISSFHKMWPDPLNRIRKPADQSWVKKKIAELREMDAINKLKQDAGPEPRSKRRRTRGNKGPR